MKAPLNHWNTHSRLWEVSQQDYLWAGEYCLEDNALARETVLLHHTRSVDEQLKRYASGSRLFLKLLKTRLLTFEEFSYLKNSRINSEKKTNCSPFAVEYWKLIQSQPSSTLLSIHDDEETHFTELLKKWIPRTSTLFFRPEPVPFPLSALHRHLIITGRTGSGKSQFMLTLFYQLQYHSNSKQQHAQVFLDPHGDISEKLLSLRLNGQNYERLWYIDPSLSSDKIPCINPFWEKVGSPVLTDLLAQQWSKAFSELIPEAGMSLSMEALLKPCLWIMFQKGSCGLFDLQIFMDDSQNQEWVALGRTSKNPVFRNFFEQSFLNKKYAPTKLAIFTRLQLLLNNYTFYQMMNGRSTVDLKQGMKQGKIMLFNLSKGKLGEDTSKALARFISATLLSIALQRAFESERNRKHCFLFADEFHNMASSSMESVFSEARKYHLHLIVGTQTVDQLPLSLKKMVLNNTAVKLVGINGLPALKSQAGDIGVSFAKLQQLAPYQFYLKYDHYPALKIKSSDSLIKHPRRYFLTSKATDGLIDYLLNKSGLYRNVDDLPVITPPSNKTSPPPTDQSYKPQFEL